jgi:hypothetical protein
VSTLPQTGGCSCEALRYRITVAPLMVYNCHCTNCQKIGGGAFSTNLTVASDAFEFVRGDPGKVTWTSDAGVGRFGWVCLSCHGRIAHGWEEASPPILNVRSGTLDDTSWINPVVDMWTASAQPWVALSEDRFRVERQPTELADYQPFFEAFIDQRNF